MFFLIFALNYTSVSVDFSQLKLFEIQFCFIAKKKSPPPFIEMAGSASDPIDNASCTIHVPELLRGLHLIRREILLWYRLHLHSNPPRSLFWFYYSCTSGVSHRIWLFLPRLQIQLAESVIMCMYLCLMIDDKHPYKTVLNTQWFVLCICGFIYFMSGAKHQNESALYTQWIDIYRCSLRHLWLHIYGVSTRTRPDVFWWAKESVCLNSYLY